MRIAKRRVGKMKGTAFGARRGHAPGYTMGGWVLLDQSALMQRVTRRQALKVWKRLREEVEPGRCYGPAWGNTPEQPPGGPGRRKFCRDQRGHPVLFFNVGLDQGPAACPRTAHRATMNGWPVTDERAVGPGIYCSVQDAERALVLAARVKGILLPAEFWKESG